MRPTVVLLGAVLIIAAVAVFMWGIAPGEAGPPGSESSRPQAAQAKRQATTRSGSPKVSAARQHEAPEAAAA